MLIAFVVAYLLVTIAIGLWAARRVHDAKDFVVAGRSLPLYMNVATVFATWFGAETVLSVSATFAKDGLGGIVADPFGSTFCLVLVAFFFARAFYRMNLLTIGDFYRKRYGKPVEVVTSLAITASYLGWTSAQLTALGLCFSVLSGGALSLNEGIVLGAAIVLFYTIWGGMWSVALTDLFQSVALKPVEYQQLQLLRALNDTRQRVLLSAADRTLLHDLGAWLPAAPTAIPPSLPLYSHTVPAGSPLLADDAVEDVIDLNTHLIPHREATFMVKVKGDSMQGAGIEEGDMLLVDRTLPPVHGKIVVAAIEGELTVKRLALRGDQVQLCPENAAYAPLTLLPEQDLQILGVVRSVIRTL